MLLSSSAGCVRVYHPMSGLHRPTVVDVQAPNFQDVHLTVHCVPGQMLSRSDAARLCTKVGTLFENQGAKVETIDTTGRVDEGLDEPGEETPEPTVRTDLTLELRTRTVYRSDHPLSWLVCIGSFTLLPGLTESTFAQDVTIRDGNGFLLVSDSMEGRIVQRFGAGPWFGNKVLDLLTREKDQRLGIGSAYRDLSRDLYQQLSQLTFNAKMQWEVLREVEQQASGVSQPQAPSEPRDSTGAVQ